MQQLLDVHTLYMHYILCTDSKPNVAESIIMKRLMVNFLAPVITLRQFTTKKEEDGTQMVG